MAIPSASICASLRVPDMPEHEVVPGSLADGSSSMASWMRCSRFRCFGSGHDAFRRSASQAGIPLLGRMVAAALVAIGGHSLRMRRADVSAYRAMLDLKLLWSGAAMAALLFPADPCPVLCGRFPPVFRLLLRLGAVSFQGAVSTVGLYTGMGYAILLGL